LRESARGPAFGVATTGIAGPTLRYPVGMGLDNPVHILLLLLVVLLVFGAKRLPEIGRSLGEGMRGFKDSISGQQSSLTAAPTPAAPPVTPVAAPVPAPVPVTVVAEQSDV
jgi:sec-independent protein translocase protein TatA